MCRVNNLDGDRNHTHSHAHTLMIIITMTLEGANRDSVQSTYCAATRMLK